MSLHCDKATEALPAAAATARVVHVQNGSIASKLVVGTAESDRSDP